MSTLDIDDLSLSYTAVYASGKALEDLSCSLDELKAFIDSLEAKYEEVLQQLNTLDPMVSLGGADFIV